jgi:Holliday junction resolvase RusA-like endonuclease
MIYEIDIVPIPKPRMTQSDRWNKRDAVSRYFAYADELRLKANTKGLKTIPAEIKRLYFVFPIPKGATKKEFSIRIGGYHQQRPDLSNLLKAVEDILCKEDSHICHIHDLAKVWGDCGKIIIEV